MESRRVQIRELGDKVETLGKELDESKRNNQNLKTSLESKRADLSKYGSEISELRKSLNKKDLEYNQKERKYSSLQNKYNQLEKENIQVKEKTSGLEEKVTGLEEANLSLENEVKYLKSPANIENVKTFLGEQSDKDYSEMKQILMEILAKDDLYSKETKAIFSKYGLDHMLISNPGGGHFRWNFNIDNTEDYTDEKDVGFFSRRFKNEEGNEVATVSFSTKNHETYEDNFCLNRLASESSDLMKAALYGEFKKIILSDEKKYSEAVKMLDKHPFLVDAGIKDIEIVCSKDVNARGYFNKYFNKK